MIAIRQQRGAALFVGIFLITVVVVFAAVVALTSSTQQLSQARASLAELAWYTAIGRLDAEVQSIVGGGGCSNTTESINGFTVDIGCMPDDPQAVSEGGEPYEIYTVTVSAQQGSTSSAVFVRRSATAQIVAGDTP